VRVDPDDTDDLVAAGAKIAVMRGRPMPGWLRVGPAEVSTDKDLQPWVERGVAFARSLTVKR
jgi:hypothetical protein